MNKPIFKGFSLPNKEAYERMNYLYQAAQFALLSADHPNVPLARHYCITLKNIAKRLVLRIDPTVKRTICKRCNCLLAPGVTSTVRVQSKPRTHLVITCNECGFLRRYNTSDSHQLWTDRALNTLTTDKKEEIETKNIDDSERERVSLCSDSLLPASATAALPLEKGDDISNMCSEKGLDCIKNDQSDSDRRGVQDVEGIFKNNNNVSEDKEGIKASIQPEDIKNIETVERKKKTRGGRKHRKRKRKVTACVVGTTHKEDIHMTVVN